ALGNSIVSGLADGIRGAAGQLWDLARSMAGNFLDGFKHALGISSHSAVFRDEVAPDIAGGLVDGLDRHRGRVAGAGAGLADAVVPAGYAGRAAGSGAAGQAGGGAFSLEIK